MFINLQKRLLSSVEAFARTLEKHATSVGATRLDLDEGPDSQDTDDENGLSSDAEDARHEQQVAAATAGLPAPAGDAASVLERMRRLAAAVQTTASCLPPRLLSSTVWTS